ncbi:adenylate cyclase [Rhodobacteraceae bacterium 4F10]|nr:adenylate cyclase [Rhodobacteraceae bacterium 4F10]
MAISGQTFYGNLPRINDFEKLTDLQTYVQLPDDWWVGVADIVGSTQEIERGRYKIVNMVGAAVISAQVNAAGMELLPYVFGGDGAGFAVWPEQRAAAETALAGVQNWAREEFDIGLRVAMVRVSDIRAAGQDIRVARYAASDGVDYAMFSGGGLLWAETQMKAGQLSLGDVAGAETADLTGLSCRWSNMEAQNGKILSVVMQPGEGVSEQDFAAISQSVLSAAQNLNREGHPVPKAGPGFRFPPAGVELETHVNRNGRSKWMHWTRIMVGNALIWVLFKSGVRLGSFKPEEYREDTARNADFRKFDDGLKMTLDCDAETQSRIEAVLKEAAVQGLVRYGLHAQDEAMMTCFVPSATENSHVHFVDGAAGGYARAASHLKARERSASLSQAAHDAGRKEVNAQNEQHTQPQKPAISVQ